MVSPMKFRISSVTTPAANLRDIRTWLLGAFGIYEEEIYVDDNDKVHYTPLEEGGIRNI